MRISDHTENKARTWLSQTLYNACGIVIKPERHDFLKARLAKRMRALKLESMTEYCNYLQDNSDEFQNTIDALTTNFTKFLREEDHFKYLVQQALPSIVRGKKFSLWCAASSSGEEPYSLAMYLDTHFPTQSGWNWTILATDISTKVLTIAERGIYPAESISTVLPDWKKKYFQEGVRTQAGNYKVRPELAERVEFRQLNLLDPFPFRDRFEVIFCRNVMIYFNKETQLGIIQRFLQHLKPNGYLFLGHSESICGQNLHLKVLKPSVYQVTA